MKGAKGDMTVGEFRMEAKATTRTSLAVELAWLVKIQYEALNSGTHPGVVISFVSPDGRARIQDWVLIPKSTFDELRER